MPLCLSVTLVEDVCKVNISSIPGPTNCKPDRRGSVEDVWAGIQAAEVGLTPIKINVVVVRGYNDIDMADGNIHPCIPGKSVSLKCLRRNNHFQTSLGDSY
jgi:hypothetical protein